MAEVIFKAALAVLIVGASIVFPVYIRALIRVEEWRRENGYQYTDYVPEDCLIGPLNKADILAVIAVFLWIPIGMALCHPVMKGLVSIFGENQAGGFAYFVFAPFLYLSSRKLFKLIWDIVEGREPDVGDDDEDASV